MVYYSSDDLLYNDRVSLWCFTKAFLMAATWPIFDFIKKWKKVRWFYFYLYYICASLNLVEHLFLMLAAVPFQKYQFNPESGLSGFKLCSSSVLAYHQTGKLQGLCILGRHWSKAALQQSKPTWGRVVVVNWCFCLYKHTSDVQINFTFISIFTSTSSPCFVSDYSFLCSSNYCFCMETWRGGGQLHYTGICVCVCFSLLTSCVNTILRVEIMCAC